MLLTGGTRTSSVAQFLTLLVLLVVVLGITYFTTTWIAGYQKGQMAASNMEIIETMRLSNNKYVQIVRIGDKYLAIAVCKDTVTVLTELSEEQIHDKSALVTGRSFKDILKRAKETNNLEKTDLRDTEGM